VLIVFGLVLVPTVFSVWISFHKIGLGNLNDVFHAPFNGLANYKSVFNDFAFKFQGLNQWGAAVTTIVYSFVSTVLTVVMGLIAAMLLNRPFRGRGLVRGIFLFPYVAPVISVAFVWRWLLDPRPSGVLNNVLMTLNLLDLPKAFLATRGLAIWLVILFQGWRYFPFAMLMILARLQAIDETLYEAADVDGASAWQKFSFVTIPQLRYVLGAIFLLRLLWTFNKFDDIWLLTGGGYGTNVLPVLTYQFSFGTYDFGKGAATAMILLAALVVFIVLYVVVVMRNLDET
jgi:multiple sugar transport system permease protein